MSHDNNNNKLTLLRYCCKCRAVCSCALHDGTTYKTHTECVIKEMNDLWVSRQTQQCRSTHQLYVSTPVVKCIQRNSIRGSSPNKACCKLVHVCFAHKNTACKGHHSFMAMRLSLQMFVVLGMPSALRSLCCTTLPAVNSKEAGTTSSKECRMVGQKGWAGYQPCWQHGQYDICLQPA